jgi:hypothetical protein
VSSELLRGCGQINETKVERDAIGYCGHGRCIADVAFQPLLQSVELTSVVLRPEANQSNPKIAIRLFYYAYPSHSDQLLLQTSD